MARNKFVPRIFANSLVGTRVECDKSELLYLKTLRASVDDAIEIFVKNNEIYSGKIAKIDFDNLWVSNIKQMANFQKENLHIHLAFGVSTKEVTRDVIDFATQASVVSIIPFISELSDRKSQIFIEKKGHKIILEAVRQSKRDSFVELSEIKNYSGVANCFKEKGVKKVIIADVNSVMPEKSFFDSDTYGVIIGPESGLTERDIKSFQAAMEEFDVATYSFLNSTLRVQAACVAIPSYIRGMHGVING